MLPEIPQEDVYKRQILNLEKYARLADRVNPQMPMIIEHLHSDDEYLESIAYLKARLEKAGIRMCN